jgi:5-hydroxyisourate hydrolase
MTFDVAGYRRSLNGQEEPAFFPQIDIVFHLRGDRERVHIPVLLSAYGYTTYRGS